MDSLSHYNIDFFIRFKTCGDSPKIPLLACMLTLIKQRITMGEKFSTIFMWYIVTLAEKFTSLFKKNKSL